MSERVGLTTLVERACFRWIDPTPEGPKDRIHLMEFGNLSFRGELLRSCQAGLQASAWWNTSDTLKASESRKCNMGSTTLWFGLRDAEADDPPLTLWNSIEQVTRLDDFLFTLEGDRNSGPLARDCREDLALLNVLADWCEDHDWPIAAAEARHLWALVVSILRE